MLYLEAFNKYVSVIKLLFDTRRLISSEQHMHWTCSLKAKTKFEQNTKVLLLY